MDTLILGIGNVLLGDEGVGVRAVELLTARGGLPPGVVCLDGGTGSLVLLEPMQKAERMILVDATADGAPPGSIRRIVPRFASDYPPSLSAHDIGLRDLLESFYLLGEEPDVVLFAVSIEWPQEIRSDLSPEAEGAASRVAKMILAELGSA